MTKSDRVVLFTLLPVLTLLLTAPQAQGQIERKDLSIDLIRGPFNNFVMPDVYSQRVLTVSNLTDRDRSARVAYATEFEDRGETVYSRTFPLPARAVREVELVILPGILRKQDAGGGGRRRSELMQNYEQRYVLWDLATGEQAHVRTDTDLRAAAESVRTAFLWNVDDPEDHHDFLVGMAPDVLGEIRAVGGAADSPPTRWYGYSLANLVIFKGVDVMRLRPSQMQALLRWVRAGGTLVIGGSEQLPDALQGELAAAAGATAAGLHYVTAFTVHDLPGPDGAEPPSDLTIELRAPLPMVELVPDSAEVLVTADGLPLLLRRRCGQGTIFTFAPAIGALGDERLQGLWRIVGRSFQTRPPVEGDLFRAAGKQTLQEIAGRRGPPRSVPAVLLLGLTGVVLVGGGALRVVRRGEWLWAGLVPLGVVLGVGLYATGRSLSDPQRLSHVSLVQGLADGTVAQQTVLEYYSGPQSRTLTFSSGGADSLIRDMGEAASADLIRTDVVLADEVLLPDQVVNMNASRALYAQGLTDTPGMDLRLTYGASGQTLEADNGLGYGLEKAVLYANRRTCRLGEVLGGRSQLRVAPEDLLGQVTFVSDAKPPPSDRPRTARPAAPPPEKAPALQSHPPFVQGFGEGGAEGVSVQGLFIATDSLDRDEKLQNELVSHLLATPRPLSTIGREPVLIGYARPCPIDPLPGHDLEAQGWTIVTWPVRIVPPAAGTPVRIPGAFVHQEYVGRGPISQRLVWSEGAEEFTPVRGEMETDLWVRPMGPPMRVGEATVRLHLTAVAGAFTLQVLGVSGGADGEGQRVELASIERPVEAQTVTIPDAERFRRDDGTFVFVLRFAPVDRGDRIRPEDWGRLHSVDAELEGIIE